MKNELSTDPSLAACTAPPFAKYLVIICILLIGVFEIATIREGHEWGDDFALYIMHAKNLSMGKAYAATGYLYNPENPNIGPTVYPPVTPLLLAPVFWFAGLSLRAMKCEMVVFFLLALAMTYIIGRQFLSWRWAVALLLMLGLSPVFFDSKEWISSDLPFLFILLAFLYAADLYISRPIALIPDSFWVGGILYLAYATRSVGLVLIPTLVLYGLLRRRVIRSLAVSAVALTLVLIQNVFLPQGEGAILKLFDPSPTFLLTQSALYFKTLHGYWLNGFSKNTSLLIFAISLLLCGLGVRVYFRRRVDIYSVFVILYSALIVAYSDPAPRYLFPIIPFYMILVLLGLCETRSMFPRHCKSLVSVASGIVLLSYAGIYVKKTLEPHKDGLADPAYMEMCQFITHNTSVNGRFISRKPRLLALITGRTASGPDEMTTLTSYMKRVGASFVITGDGPGTEDLQQFCSGHPAMFQLVYRSGGYMLYRYLTSGYNP